MKKLEFSLDRPDILQSTLVSLATLAALAMLGWVMAYWTWQWFSPRVESRVPAAARPAARAESAADLFGKSPRESVSSESAINVLGVIAASGGGSGYAIMRFAGQPAHPVREGDEIAPGIRLSEVHPDKVVLEHSGIFETLALSAKNISPETSPLRQANK